MGVAAEAVANGTNRESRQLYPSTDHSVGVARHALRETLESWDATDLRDSAELVLSELVTNAIRHASVHAATQVLVRLELRPEQLRIEVSDGDSLNFPRKMGDWGTGLGGRGLLLVEALSARWGAEPRRIGVGKTVWAELERKC